MRYLYRFSLSASVAMHGVWHEADREAVDLVVLNTDVCASLDVLKCEAHRHPQSTAFRVMMTVLSRLDGCYSHDTYALPPSCWDRDMVSKDRQLYH